MSTFNEGEIISDSDVEEILDISDLERFFNLFYYVQQEENTLFLKNLERIEWKLYPLYLILKKKKKNC